MLFKSIISLSSSSINKLSLNINELKNSNDFTLNKSTMAEIKGNIKAVYFTRPTFLNF